MKCMSQFLNSKQNMRTLKDWRSMHQHFNNSGLKGDKSKDFFSLLYFLNTLQYGRICLKFFKNTFKTSRKGSHLLHSP